MRYEIEPERIIGVGAKAVFKTTDEAAAAFARRGLRANLESASLITGQQTIALELDPTAANGTIGKQGDDYVLPTGEGGGFAGLTSSATDLLNQVNRIPFGEIGQTLEGLLKSVNGVADDPQMKKALTDLSSMIGGAHDLVHQPEQRLHEDVDHRPATDPSHNVIETGSIAEPSGRSTAE